MLDIKQSLVSLNQSLVACWVVKNNALHKQFELPNFTEAMGLMVKIGLLAEKMNHHPEMINVYNKLTINLSTHDTSSISEKDFQLATKIEQLIK